MSFNQKKILRDADGAVIPQYWDEKLQEFRPLTPDKLVAQVNSPYFASKGFLTGNSNKTHTFSEQMNGFGIFNTGTTPLMFTIGEETIEVDAGGDFESNFEPFTTVSIIATSSYRAYGLKLVGAVVFQPDDILAPTITFTPDGGVFKDYQQVQITTSEPCEIYYTINGALPTVSSTQYFNPITIENTSVLKVLAIDTAGNESNAQITFTKDITAPNNVGEVNISNLSATSVTLSWPASTSDDVAAYEVYQGDVLLATVNSLSYTVSGLVALTNYTFTIKAKDALGNVASGTLKFVTTTDIADVTAPENATLLQALNITQSSLMLQWTKSISTDASSYDIYKDNIIIGNTTSNSFEVTGLDAFTQYNFNVKTKDGAGNVSTGISINAKTKSIPDTIAPENISNLNATNITQTTLDLTWTASPSIDIESYLVYKNNVLLGETANLTYNVTGLTALTSYDFKVIAKDSSGNLATGVTVNKTTLPVPDTTAPNNASNLTTSNLSTTSVTLNWTASDSSDIAGYDIYNGANFITTTTSTSYTVTGLTQGTTYTLWVKAKDASNNVASGISTQITTLVPDTTAPVITINPAAGTYTSSQSVTLTANETATIYYTTDGSTPTYPVSGTTAIYSAPITVGVNKTIKYFGRDTSGNQSTVQTAAYTINIPLTPGTVLISDAFDRAASTTLGTADTGQAWSVYSDANGTWTLGINASGQVYPSGGTYTAGVNKFRRFNKITVPSNNYSIEIDTITSTTTPGKLAVGIRLTGSGDMLYLQKASVLGTTGANYILAKLPAGGSVTNLATGTILAGANDKIKIENYSDGTLKVYINGTLDITSSDTTIPLNASSNVIGLGTEIDGNLFDNLIVKQM